MSNMSRMSEWAEQEVEIACKKENPDWDGKSFDYGCECYQTSLKAFKSLCEDTPSGMSLSFIKNILIRLMEGLPLTPINDEDFFMNGDTSFESDEELQERGLKSHLQCPRMGSLFRKETLDGKVSYNDVDRAVLIDTQGYYWSNGLADRIVDKMFPITMPYYPSKNKYEVYCEKFLLDTNNGDYDHIVFTHLIAPNGDRIELDEYYKEQDDKLVKISKEEYLKDKALLNK